MKITRIIIFTVLLFSINTLFAQTKMAQEHLKGLTKALPAELAKKKISFDGETIPVYDVDGKRIRGQEMMTAMMSGKYAPDFYLDTKKDIKAISLRLATAEEQAQMKNAQQRMTKKSKLVGKKATDFEVTAIDGTTYTLSELKGKTVVLNFWFVECKPCVMEIPELNELVKKYKNNKDIIFLGLATNRKEQLETFLKKQAFGYNIVPETRNVAATYGVSGYPTHIVIGKNGKITFVATGLSPTTVHNLEEAIKTAP